MQQNENHLTITGKIRYSMTNDYMFRSTLQSNPKILRGLLGSLLHIQPDEIEDISIENPILLGESFKDKKYILDILVKLNKCSYINLEMQLLNKHNWSDCSLLYLCRVFSNLEIGDDYCNVKPATHIGFVNYTDSPANPQFYSTFKLLDTMNHRVFSDKLVLSVVDLTQVNLATDEDKAYQIDRWAKIFKANTWEELRMLTRDNEYMEEVTKTLFNCNMDPKICKQCQDWEFEQKLIKMEENQRKKLELEAARLSNENTELTHKNTELANKNYELANKNYELTDKNCELTDKNCELTDKNCELTDKNCELTEENTQLRDEIALLKTQLASLSKP